MSMFAILVKVLAKPLGAFLLKKWLGELEHLTVIRSDIHTTRTSR